MSDIRTTVEGHVGVAEICRAPNNFFDIPLIRDLAAAFEGFDADPAVRSVVLCADGRNFCAGADFSAPARDTVGDPAGVTCISKRCGCFVRASRSSSPCRVRRWAAG